MPINQLMKSGSILLTILWYLFWPVHWVEASWLIDAERFHVSAHGQISCRDCHSEISEKQDHPNPEDVNKTLNDFFRPDQCTDCHEDVLDDINEGTLCRESVTDRGKLNVCIGCHDPHYQTSYPDSAVLIDHKQPAYIKCSGCHELQKSLPKLSSEDELCMTCHRLISPEDPNITEIISHLCFYCHAETPISSSIKKSMRHPRIDVSEYG